MSVAYAGVCEAARRLRGIAHRTPVLHSRTLDALAGAEVFLKCENLQRMGAFKFRGAYNVLAALSPSERAAGVVAFSSGNHAQGVALAAQLLGIAATIVMPSDAPAGKIAATRGYGAEVVFYERARGNREEIARAIVAERGATLVPPYDHPGIVAGAGTAALELLEDAGRLDAIVVPVGGGGLLSGTALAAHGVNLQTKVYGVEPEAGDDFAQSLARGERVNSGVPQTIADGLQTPAPGVLTFEIAQRHGCRVVTVSDDELRDAFERPDFSPERFVESGVAMLDAVAGFWDGLFEERRTRT